MYLGSQTVSRGKFMRIVLPVEWPWFLMKCWGQQIDRADTPGIVLRLPEDEVSVDKYV